MNASLDQHRRRDRAFARRNSARKAIVFSAGLAGAFSVSELAAAEPRFEAGGRLGYALHLGELESGTALADITPGRVPLWVDLGVRLTPALSLASYLEVGAGLPGRGLERECDVYESDDIACEAETGTLRIGFQSQLHLAPGAELDPWVGLTAGYEWMVFQLELDAFDDVSELSHGAHGFEFGLQGGADYRLSSGAALGPFASIALGRYHSYVVECEGECGEVPRSSGDIAKPSLHTSLMFGVRVVVLP